MGWQNTFTLGKREKGCHLVTEEVLTHIRPGLEGHTSAALTVNENYDSDMDMALDHLVPESLNWRHTDEGPEWIFVRVSHTKASLIGSSITIPITDGRLNLGTWQEFRHYPHSRRIVATVLWVH
ncbi:hypothetical protein CVT25_010245 [Psilocybe cyanescens]|uniref:Secondary thiamine-phosphate synthase enzyme n=1 Tax=Psilocybe cyanescens TaxID=93625 RepID=A0A409XCZ0_PSICY|nr:hypothetical protein CVT25_010245 [Psilocybe cyanescens]